MPVTPPVVLTIAGFDPSSGAGITADIKTIAAHECYGVSCITALTVQSTQGVRRVEGVYPVDPKIVAATLDELLADVTIEAVHIGMLGNEHVVAVVADFLDRARLPHIVLDPILKSSSGADLLDASGTRLLIERLLPLAELVTPNQVEAGVMTGIAVTDLDQMREAAARLHALGAANVVITGGDAPAGPAAGSHPEKAIDLLSFTAARGMQTEVFKADRQRSNSTHGTGCAFSTALACHLAHGRGLPEAVLLAKVYVSAAITNAHPLGKGVGPLQHLYRMSQQRRPSTVVSETEHAHSRN
ncbi:MAG TPA: bifunctional hydroxymethylpyrimidine kinase/phosphomethylpyrimidine kinase [Terriglobales bacterium]|jgi:hydroxymethylpyrimidine/phosphomethylpyrimidine kinase|nr:bifunctional hydroxymethylpyrimidine kinase/phosphomethylpyrimidine kinase [Terriglobales bacterium]